MGRYWASLVFLVFQVSLFQLPVSAGLRNKPRYTEEERMAEYVKRGYKFPFDHYYPNTEGWNRLMKQRIAQIMANPELQQKWDGFIQTLSSGLTVPNYTEFGWGLTHAPEQLTADIQQAIREGLPTARSEGKIDVITGPNVPLFIDRPDLTARVSTYDIWRLRYFVYCRVGSLFYELIWRYCIMCRLLPHCPSP